jgi:hypothetical protein
VATAGDGQSRVTLQKPVLIGKMGKIAYCCCNLFRIDSEAFKISFAIAVMLTRSFGRVIQLRSGPGFRFALAILHFQTKINGLVIKAGLEGTDGSE